MKIVHIAPPWLAIPPKNYGGTETVIHCLVEEQVSQGHEVTLIASGDSQTQAHLVSFFPHALREDNIPWHAHHKAYIHLNKALEYISLRHFDILHTHLSSGSDMYLFPLLAPLSLPHITTLHSKLPFVDEEIPEDLVFDNLMEWAPYLPMVAISESTRNQQGIPLNFIEVVHHGIPLDEYTRCESNADNYFLWLGRFSPEKGAHLAIEAAKQAKVPLVLAGTIDEKNEETKAYYHNQIEPHCDGQHINYIGPADMEQKIQLMSKARAFLNPIEWEEPFGMVMIEAMALGCPVISFARGAAPEIINDGKTGFLVQNVAEMVQCMSKLGQLKRDDICRYVRDEFSVQTMAKRYEAAYQKVIDLRQQGFNQPYSAQLT